jgi:hypothetical protein
MPAHHVGTKCTQLARGRTGLLISPVMCVCLVARDYGGCRRVSALEVLSSLLPRRFVYLRRAQCLLNTRFRFLMDYKLQNHWSRRGDESFGP